MFEPLEHQRQTEASALKSYAAVYSERQVCEWQHFQVRA